MIEKFWTAIGPRSLTAPGTTRGRLTVATTFGYKVKMTVTVLDPVLPQLRLEIKRVLSATQFEVGEIGQSLTQRTDMTAYGATSSIIVMEQGRNPIPDKEMVRATYEEEPTVAWRVIGVDYLGNPWSADNPLPTTAVIQGNVNLDAFAIRVIYFNASDWLANTMVVIPSGPPTIPGEIGPHDLPLDRLYDTDVYKYVGPTKTIVVGLNINQNLLTGEITIQKAGLVPAFSGICLIRSYLL